MRIHFLRKSIFSLILLLFILQSVLFSVQRLYASSVEPVILSSDQVEYTLRRHLSYCEDLKGDFSFQKIKTALKNRQCTPLGDRNPSFGYTASTYWAHVVIKNPLQIEKKLLLELTYPFMKNITIYHSVGGRLVTRMTGGLELRRTEQEVNSRNHVFSFTFAPMSENCLTMRFENGGPMSFPLTLWEMKAFINKVGLERIILGLFYGVLCALLIYNFTIFVFLRDKSYLYYVIFLAVVILYQLGADGIGYQYFWKASQWFSVNSIILWHTIIITYLYFSRSYLELVKYVPRLDKILILIICAVFVDAILALFWNMIYALKIALFIQIFGTLFLVWISILCIRGRSRPAKFYFGAMVFLLTGALVNLLGNAGFLPQNVFTIWGVHWGITGEALLLSVGLADRINSIKNERLLAQNAAIANKQLFIDTLQKAEQRIKQIFNNAVEGIFQISSDNDLIFANPAMARIFGYDSVDDMLTSTVDIQSLFNNKTDYEVSLKQLFDNQRYVNYEVPFLKKNGEVFYATMSIQVPSETTALDDSTDHNVFAEGMVLDITDRHLLERAERKLKIAEEANQAKIAFLANVSHELRSPLQAILGYAGLGMGRIKDITQEKTLSYFEEISVSGNRLLKQINDLLDLSKLEENSGQYSFSKERLSITTLYVIREMESIRQARGIFIQFTPPDFDDVLDMDSEKIILVIRNLLANALRFSNQHDVIDILIEKLNAGYQFSIRDRGFGIPEDETDLIFDRFVQSSKNRKKNSGTGLGLSISKKIIEDHGGKIWAENHPAGGAVFHFRLPESQNQHVRLDDVSLVHNSSHV